MFDPDPLREARGVVLGIALGYVRPLGARKYQLAGKSRSRRKAYRMLADEIESGKWKRGAVHGDEGPRSYYEPTLLVEMYR